MLGLCLTPTRENSVRGRCRCTWSVCGRVSSRRATSNRLTPCSEEQHEAFSVALACSPAQASVSSLSNSISDVSAALLPVSPGQNPSLAVSIFWGRIHHHRADFYNPFILHLFPFPSSPVGVAVLRFPDPESPFLTPFDTSQRRPTPRRVLVCADRRHPAEIARRLCLRFAAGAAEAASITVHLD